MNDLSRRALNRQVQQQKLLEVALSVFARLGYSGTSMDKIARIAGLSKPTLYRRFTDTLGFDPVSTASRAFYDPDWRPSAVTLGRYIGNGLRVFCALMPFRPSRNLPR